MNGSTLLRRSLLVSPPFAAFLYAAVIALLPWIGGTIAGLLAQREQWQRAK